LDIAGILKPSDPDSGSVLWSGSRGLPKCPERKGRWPNAKAWNCCCCPRRDSTTHQTETCPWISRYSSVLQGAEVEDSNV